MYSDDDPSKEMIHDLGLDPALDEDIGDDPLLRQARRNVEGTVRHAHEQHEQDEKPG
ncbi:MAG TPA: hypothetical protein VMD91_14515 [Candidatus Sulfotelmatobacter sp.]|nr:hypothetical protein [Candidatus Sulfotelmatobacter sp.]